MGHNREPGPQHGAVVSGKHDARGALNPPHTHAAAHLGFLVLRVAELQLLLQVTHRRAQTT